MMSMVIGFYEFDEENGYLSNWYPSEFTVHGVKFSSMEQYMMYQKALTFYDRDSANLIIESDNPAEIKKFGKMVANYDEVIWNGVRQPIVFRGLMEKFRQNEDLREKLLDTGDEILAECSPKDKIWGIGLALDDIRRCELNAWKGQNLLGFALMVVRDELRKEFKNK